MHPMGHSTSTSTVSSSCFFLRTVCFHSVCFVSSNASTYLTTDGEGCQLSWTRRMKIVIGIARGLKYLHSELEPPFTISELNSSAVYLTEDFSPKVKLKYQSTYSKFLNYVYKKKSGVFLRTWHLYTKYSLLILSAGRQF